jgi:hypothetical protein
MDVCDELGVPIAENKTVGPSNIITFLGFIIDTVLMMVRIPEEKLQKPRNLLQPHGQAFVYIIHIIKFYSKQIKVCRINY